MNNIVLVGAGGTGMSGLAMMLFDIGYKNIVCINNVQNNLTDRLVRHGLKVIIGHGNYTVDIKDFVIYSDIQAIIDGPETTQSRVYQQSSTKKHFHICITYNQFIAEISKRFTTISVSGSNGKTSTTAMLIYALSHLAGDQFGLGIVGGLMPDFSQQGYAINSDNQIQGNIRHLFEHIFNQKHQLDFSLIKKYLFVVEACEHKEHFLLYDTNYILVTNISWDHTDYYLTRESYKQAFVRMIDRTKSQTILSPIAYETLSGYTLPTVTVSDIFLFENSCLVGSYSYANASMVKNLLTTLGHQDDDQLKAILSRFQGVGRRMEYLGVIGQKSLYTDYSHHAPALLGNIQALKKQFPDKKLCIVFQPHQAQRVLVGRDDFGQALQDIDTTIIYKLYTAREDFTSLQQEFSRLQSVQNFDELGEQFAQGLSAEYIIDTHDLLQSLSLLSDDYIIVVFSAGDLDEKIRIILK